ncbi:MAG: hypothetical protein WCO13_08015 [Bacteroidota bacterium]
MDLQTRKLQLIQEFLSINSLELINKIDKFLHEEKKKEIEQELEAMSIEQFDEMINLAEEDFANGRYIEAKSLKEKIKKWK